MLIEYNYSKQLKKNVSTYYREFSSAEANVFQTDLKNILPEKELVEITKLFHQTFDYAKAENQMSGLVNYSNCVLNFFFFFAEFFNLIFMF